MFLWHCHTHLSASLANLLFPRLLSVQLTIIKEAEKDVIALFYRRFPEISAKEITNMFHLRVHYFAVCLYYMGREHHKREEESVSVSLL
jgi:hypothetical protein